MHAKLAVFDDDVIITGANFEKRYFTNRRDRYIKVTNSPLSNYVNEFVQIFVELGHKIEKNQSGLIPP